MDRLRDRRWLVAVLVLAVIVSTFTAAAATAPRADAGAVLAARTLVPSAVGNAGALAKLHPLAVNPAVAGLRARVSRVLHVGSSPDVAGHRVFPLSLPLRI